MKNRPAAFFHWLFRRSARNQRAPVPGLQFDIEAELAQHFRGEQRLRLDDRLIGRRDDDDLLALVAGFLDELLRLFEVALALHWARANLARKRRAAREIGIAGMADLRIA